MMPKKQLVWAALVAASVVSPLLVSGNADACGGAIFQGSFQRPTRIIRPGQAPTSKPAPARLIAQAEKAFDEGRMADALRTAIEAYPNIATANPSNDVMMNRALRLAAVVTARSGGARSPSEARTPEQRAGRVEWAIRALRGLYQRNPSNVTLEGDLGEALAMVPEHEEEAHRRLSSLADRDLLGSAHAYSALARLHFSAGLTKKSVQALQRCSAIATKPATCGPQLPLNPA